MQGTQYAPRESILCMEHFVALQRTTLEKQQAHDHITFGPKYGKILSQFFMLTKHVGRTNIDLSKSDLTEFVNMLVSPPHSHPLMIYHHLINSKRMWA